MRFLLIIFLFATGMAFGQQQTNERAKWFTDARFGMFIHWGIYSGAEGYWKGEKLRNDNDYAEWLFYRNRLSKEEYLTLLNRFRWDEIDPEQWVILAKKSGMKYLVFTAKHHDGFALWDSRASDYNIGKHTDPKRDIVKELAEACKKHGIKLGLYYSHWVDWEHPYGWDHTKEIYPITTKQYDRYWQEKVIPQMRELLTNYGEISIIWFDMWIHHSESIITTAQLLQLKNLIRELQPNCIVNSRLGLSIKEDPDIDFKTLGDNQLGNKKEDFPWQSPATVAHSWGFHATDSHWKSTSTLLHSLINNVSLNGNFILNIGPRANGDVPFEIEQRMLEMGNWLNINGEAIYGTQAFELPKNQHNWGKITCKEGDGMFKLFFHVFNRPLNNQLYITGINSAPDKVYMLADKSKQKLTFAHSGPFTKIHLPQLPVNDYVSVVVAEYPVKPVITNGLVGKTSDNGYSLTPENSTPGKESLAITPKQRRGTIPPCFSTKKEKELNWKIYIDTPGEKQLDVSYSFQGNSQRGEIKITAAGQTLQQAILPTGKTVGEPGQNWVIDNFASHSLGKITFPDPGLYSISLKLLPEGEEKIKFQWVWVQDQ